jgi:hypothetical protein
MRWDLRRAGRRNASPFGQPQQPPFLQCRDADAQAWAQALHLAMAGPGALVGADQLGQGVAQITAWGMTNNPTPRSIQQKMRVR